MSCQESVPVAAEPAVDVLRRDDGTLVLTSPYQPSELYRSTAHVLIERAEQFPERTLIAEKDPSGEWQHLTYREAVAGCSQVAQWLIDHGASPEKPLAILSESSIKHFLMAWGAIFAGVPYVPVSYSYSTVPGAFPKLQAILETVNPTFLFAENMNEHSDALRSIAFDLSEVVSITAEGTLTGSAASFDWQEVIETEVTDDVEHSLVKITHDTVTRYMFTSGSTGMPKGVIHTHGMACQFLAGIWVTGDPTVNFLETRSLDWMPWSHVGAGVMRVHWMINAAGSIYLDTGKPVPGEYYKTIENLRAAKPTVYNGAPLGWSMLADALEADNDLAEAFFSNLRTIIFGSAAMPASLSQRIQTLIEKHKGIRLLFGTSLASTEVMCGLSRYWPCEEDSVIGLPFPGSEIKLVPVDDKYEIRIRSKGTTPGYLNAAEKTADSFDEEGFFKMGDAVRFADEDNPVKGLVFAGRVSEEFKLQSGTWVSAGTLRAEVVAATSPYVRDVVVCGLNQADITLLVWPNLETAGELAQSKDPGVIARSTPVQQAIREGLKRHNGENPASSKRIARFLLLSTPPDVGAFEITDKGYVNQGEVQRRRVSEVERLYSPAPNDSVILVE